MSNRDIEIIGELIRRERDPETLEKIAAAIGESLNLLTAERNGDVNRREAEPDAAHRAWILRDALQEIL